MDTRETIELLFGYQALCDYNSMPFVLQDKYRLYLTRRRIYGQLYKNLFEPTDDCLEPYEWLQQYEEKKSFEEISLILGISTSEVREIYNSAIEKLRQAFKNRKQDNTDFLE
jgi:hypothetical protein